MPSDTSKLEPLDPFESLREPPYRWFLVGGFVLFLSTQIQTVVLGWQIYSLTGDPLSLGFIGLAEAIPFLSLTLVGGYIADRMNRKILCLIALAPIFLASLTLVILNWNSSMKNIWIFYAVQALGGIGRAFFRPAYQALASELVPSRSYLNASTMRSGMFHIALVVGPAVGGLLISFGYRTAYLVEAILILAALMAYTFIRHKPKQKEHDQENGFFEGVRFVFSEKIVLGALSLDLFAVLFGGASALLPVFAKDILKVGEVGFGFLRSAPAVGSILMSAWIVFRPPSKNAGQLLLICVALFGISWVSFALSQYYLLSLFLLICCGAADNVSVIMRSALVQRQTPAHLMGRVGAVNSFFIGSSNEIGAFESGVAARLLGTVSSVIFGGLMTLMTVGLIAWKNPALRKLQRL